MSAIAMGVVGGVGSLLGLGGQLGGAAMQANAARDAANTQAAAEAKAAQMQYDAEQQAIQEQKAEFAQQQAELQPYLQAGQSALPQLQQMAENPQQFTKEQFLNNMDPAYQFDLQQGQQALQRSAAASGGLMSGGTLKDITNYAQGMASNEYGNAYNRFMNNQNTQFGRLQALSGLGQTATGQSGQVGMNSANNVSGIIQNYGNNMAGMTNALGSSQAASQMAGANAWAQALGGGAQALNQNMTSTVGGIQGMSMMNKMLPGGGSGGLGGGLAGGGGGLLSSLAFV